MADLKTDYKDQLLDTSVNTERKFNLVDSGGNVIASGVTLRDITQYSQAGDTFGAADVNKITTEINGINTNLTAVKYDGSLTNALHGFYLYKRNNDVYLNGYFSGSFSNNSIITTLPEGFRPKTKLSRVCVMSRSSSSSQYISGADVDINTDGTIVSTNDTSWVAIIFNNKFPIDI